MDQHSASHQSPAGAHGAIGDPPPTSGPTQPANDKSYQNLYVAGLHPSVTDNILAKWFEPFGAIRSAKVMLNVRTGTSRGFGFVLFAEEASGRAAFQALHKSTQSSDNPTDNAAPGAMETVTSELSIEPSEHDGNQAAAESSVVYLRNIPADVPEVDVLQLCRKVGRVTGFTMAPILPRHATRRRERERAAAVKAAGEGATGEGHVVPDATVDLPGGSSLEDSRPPVFEGDISATLSTSQLGLTVTSAGNQALFLASVEFETVEQARAAIALLHQSKPFASCTIPLLAKYADSAELKEYRLKQRKARQVLAVKESARARTQGEHGNSPKSPSGTPLASSPACQPPGPLLLGGKQLASVVTPGGSSKPKGSSFQPHQGPAANAPGPRGMPPPPPFAQATQMQVRGAQLPPLPPGQVIYYRGTLKANGDGTFSIVQPDAINFTDTQPALMAAPGLFPTSFGPQGVMATSGMYGFPPGTVPPGQNSSFAGSLMSFQPTFVPVSIGASIGMPQHMLVMPEAVYQSASAADAHSTPNPPWLTGGNLTGSAPPQPQHAHQPQAAPVPAASDSLGDATVAVET